MKNEIPNCHPFDKKCEEFCDHRTKIVLKDKRGKSQFLVNNPNRFKVCCLLIDGCLIESQEEEKTDFLLLKCPEKGDDKTSIAYLVELKGSDLIKAVRQINNSLNILLPKLGEYSIINGRIVTTRIDKIDLGHTDYKALGKRLKKLNGTLEQKSILMEENI
ncbi:MAG: hypothetical protein RLZZ306_1498 [Bacteroidota bacterium]|jgi:hypothetical protein